MTERVLAKRLEKSLKVSLRGGSWVVISGEAG